MQQIDEIILNSNEEVDAYKKIRNEDYIRKIEKKLLRLNRMPYLIFFTVVFYCILISLFSKSLVSWYTIIFLGAMIAIVDNISVKRTMLIKELFHFKYE